MKHDILRTTGKYGPGTRNAFTLNRTPGNRIAYYIHEPLLRLNRLLSGTTTSVLSEPPE